jgi:hypothetical protein
MNYQNSYIMYIGLLATNCKVIPFCIAIVFHFCIQLGDVLFYIPPLVIKHAYASCSFSAGSFLREFRLTASMNIFIYSKK